ncbi:MAG TPA: cytochrome P450 [Anaerolineales bacterium]|jgi:unspecific monooxygenase
MSPLPVYHLDLNDSEFIRDPYPRLHELREHKPVFRDERWNKVFFTRHAAIAALLRDKRLGRRPVPARASVAGGAPPRDARLADFDRYQENVFMDWEPPDHTRIRSLVTKVFTPRRVEGLLGKLESTTHRLIDAAEDGGLIEFVREIAEPLPVLMIADLLGIPEADRHRLRPWSAAIVKIYELDYSEEQMVQASRAAREFMEYIGGLAEQRRVHPEDDLITGLVQSEHDGGTLSDDELRATCIFLLNAGHEATVNGSALGLLALVRDPAQFDLLQGAAHSPDGAGLIKTAVDELLRYDSPLPMFERWVGEDMQVDGVPLERGTAVALLYASGNRDARRFGNPDRLDVARTDNPLLTFGLGTHYCLGAPLARLELQILFKVLLQRLPRIRLAAEPEYNDGFVIRGLKSLTVTT